VVRLQWPYPIGTNQLEAAESFLKVNQVALVTLDIGANDVDGCIRASGIDEVCLRNGLASVGSNLPFILRRLRQAAGLRTTIVAMNYYDPFLVAWTLGANGQALALESLEATTSFNLKLESIYLAFGIPVTNVAQAFRTDNFTPVPAENPPVPINVFLIGAWTWMGAPPPYGPDVHPNNAGYAAIAGAFASK
jgi:lysophospholipase L1-like esterase